MADQRGGQRRSAPERRIGAPLRSAPRAARGGEHLVADGVDHHADDDLAVDLGGDRHVEAGEAVEVVGGAVERVDDPAHAAACPAVLAALLAEDAVVGPGAERCRRRSAPRTARSISVTMSVAVDLVLDLGRGPARARRAAARRPSRARPLGQRRAARSRSGIAGHGRTRLPVGVPDARRPRRPALRHRHPARPPAMRRAMAEAEVGDDGYGEDPTVSAPRGGVRRAGRQGGGAVRAVGHDGQPDRAAPARPGPARRSSPAGASTSSSTRTAAAGAQRRRASSYTVDDADGTLDPADVRLGGRGRRPPLAAGRRWSSSRTPTCPSGGRAVAARAARRRSPPSGCRCTSTAPGCSTPRWRPASPAAELRRAGHDRDVLPVEGARRAGRARCWPGPPTSIAAARRRAQAPRRRHAPGRRPRRRRARRPRRPWSTGWPTTTRRARRLAEAVAERWPDAGSTRRACAPTSSCSTPPDAGAAARATSPAEGVLAGTIAPGVVRLVTHLDVDDDGLERARRRASAAAPA